MISDKYLIVFVCCWLWECLRTQCKYARSTIWRPNNVLVKQEVDETIFQYLDIFDDFPMLQTFHKVRAMQLNMVFKFKFKYNHTYLTSKMQPTSTLKVRNSFMFERMRLYTVIVYTYFGFYFLIILWSTYLLFVASRDFRGLPTILRIFIQNLNYNTPVQAKRLKCFFSLPGSAYTYRGSYLDHLNLNWWKQHSTGCNTEEYGMKTSTKKLNLQRLYRGHMLYPLTQGSSLEKPL